MKKNDFLIRIAEALDYEGPIQIGQDLESIDGWDSLGILSVIEVLEELGVQVSVEEIYEVKKIDDLLVIAGINLNDD